MAGRKRAFPQKLLEDLFHRYESEIVREDGHVLRPKDKFWSKMKRQHNIPSSEKSIYTSALRWHKLKSKKIEGKHIVGNDCDDIFLICCKKKLQQKKLNR